ncbi:flagellar basal body rod modification protein FlgD [Legionella gratiana]|uniref:Basal-body rod modification protein FlgD n=1 Tax=Legionella gratiana TaxID=45066 RepID=A0A378JKT8_9GAMM|nr:flagellar hook assembly protein FlgD [Legionella gratiana]KTD06509.1 flagellar basal body rod modification protein FlgD [Legionella gratiana]STX45330.1 flagellar basal body rod modification protein FlgD [Legionella gratiana]
MTKNSFNETDTLSSSLEQIDSSIKKTLREQDFLHLMMEQIQDHDFMQPQVNYEFLSQLAQFAAHEQGTEMQESLQQLTTSLQSNQALQASALVGRKVLVDSSIFRWDTENCVRIVIDVLPGISMLRHSIYTESGEHIKTIALEKPEPGFFQINWDGIGDNGKKVNEGRYKVEAYAVYEGKDMPLQTLILVNVNSVSLGQNGEGLKLNVAGIGSISLDRVRQISV